MKSRMPIMGIGLKLIVSTAIYSILLLLLISKSGFNFSISCISNKIIICIGVLLTILGLALLIPSIIAINKAYKSDSLYTKGVYAFCRHPLYSSWIIFIIPGILLLFNSWILLTIPIILYLFFKVMIKQEETYLQQRFGDQYLEYKKKVGLLFPKFWKKIKK